MGVSEERLRVLRMLEEGKVTPEEATSLLRALSKGEESRAEARSGEAKKRFLRIRVTDTISGSAKVNVTIPVSLVSAGLRIAERFAPEAEGIDMAELEDAILSGAEGKIVEVMDSEDNERVEIYVE